MTTAAENERLGVLETEVAHIKTDVTEIKTDVKLLVSAQAQLAIDLAAKNAAEAAVAKSQSQIGGLLKFATERALSLAAMVVAIWAALQKG